MLPPAYGKTNQALALSIYFFLCVCIYNDTSKVNTQVQVHSIPSNKSTLTEQ